MKIISSAVYWIVRGLSKVFATIICPTKVTGKEYTKTAEPFIFCANHMSILDPAFLVGKAISRKTYFMGKAELYKTKIGNWFFRSLLSFPVYRGTADMNAIRTSIDYLKAGKSMAIFPEGTRNKEKNGELQDFYNGVGIIALNSGCNIIPCYIDSKGGYKLFKRVRVNIGAPIDIKQFEEDGIKKENLNKIMRLLKEKMMKLM